MKDSNPDLSSSWSCALTLNQHCGLTRCLPPHQAKRSWCTAGGSYAGRGLAADAAPPDTSPPGPSGCPCETARWTWCTLCPLWSTDTYQHTQKHDGSFTAYRKWPLGPRTWTSRKKKKIFQYQIWHHLLPVLPTLTKLTRAKSCHINAPVFYYMHTHTLTHSNTHTHSQIHTHTHTQGNVGTHSRGTMLPAYWTSS